MGFELKNETTSKTTFGDWSANEYIFTNPEYASIFTGKTKLAKRDKFLEIFGKPNPDKYERLSWSGEPCPKIGKFNNFGQKLDVLGNGDIIVMYSYSKDNRKNKSAIIPAALQKDNIEIVRWYIQ